MVADKLHEKTAECEGHMDDQPIFVAAEIEDHPIVAHEIDGVITLTLDSTLYDLNFRLCLRHQRNAGYGG